MGSTDPAFETGIGSALLFGPMLWLAGAVFFDFVHFVLHAMLRSRVALLRALAWPHGVHHGWIDGRLEVQWQLQRRNVFCHIVPEYLTQLVFTAAVAWLLPLAFAVVLGLLQTGVFLYVLSQAGLDPNHRPVKRLDAYRPGPWTPPAYHALHHVHPDAYFSAYTKLVDVLVGSGAQLRGRRFLLLGGEGPFGPALAEALADHGVERIERAPHEPAAGLAGFDLASLDVLVLCDPEQDPTPRVEAFVAATRERRLPPEVWACHRRDDDATARHYHEDVRVHYRTIVLAEPDARTAARRVVGRVRRGCHYVHTGSLVAALGGWWRFRSTRPEPPLGARLVRRRDALEPLPRATQVQARGA
jgi:hypothetical protein